MSDIITRRLPDGRETSDAAEYARAWHQLADPIAHAFGLSVVGWDPGILFRRNDSDATIDLPTWFALDLRAAISKATGAHQ